MNILTGYTYTGTIKRNTIILSTKKEKNIFEDGKVILWLQRKFPLCIRSSPLQKKQEFKKN